MKTTTEQIDEMLEERYHELLTAWGWTEKNMSFEVFKSEFEPEVIFKIMSEFPGVHKQANGVN